MVQSGVVAAQTSSRCLLLTRKVMLIVIVKCREKFIVHLPLIGASFLRLLQLQLQQLDALL